MVFVTLLSCWVVSREIIAFYRNSYYPEENPTASQLSPDGADIWTVIFSWYCLLIHILVTAIPLRACWAIWDLTGSLRKTACSKTSKDSRDSSSASPPDSETLTPSSALSSASSESDDLLVDPDLYAVSDSESERVIHAIIIPNYREEMDTLRETLDVLASHPRARCGYDVSEAQP